MIFQKKVDRAFDYLKEQKAKRESERKDIPYREDDELEKGDLFSMIVAAFIVFAPVFLILLVLIVLSFIFL